MKSIKLLSVVSKFVVTAGTSIGVKPACPGYTYQPKAPKHLVEKK